MLITKKIKTSSREEILDITGEIQNVIRESSIQNGICLVYIPHTTCAVTINENADSDVKRDILYWLKKHIPQNDDFHHAEGNSDAHIKTLMSGQSVQLIIENSKPILGTWQGIYFCEFDGPRNRNYFVKIING
ncbi:MAG: secondary thiamine-phosphate synthase enzyme YjbQ [Leptospirales bacterium]